MKINLIIKKSIYRKQKETKDFSLRSLAKKLDIQHSFLSSLLSNKKKWPLSLLDKVIQILEVDSVNRHAMAEILIDEQIKELRKKSKLIRDFSTQKKTPLIRQKIGVPINLFSEEYPNENPLISHWYFIALLDLTTCQDFSALTYN